MNHIDPQLVSGVAKTAASLPESESPASWGAAAVPPADWGADVTAEMDAEFGAALEGLDSAVSRRRWLQIMGASLALGAASTGCRYKEEQLAPYAFRPHNRTPGIPVRYATMMEFAGVAHPLEAISFDGRPIKLDGNKLHPDSLGKSDTFTQARILELYDPERLRTPLRKNGDRFDESNWQAFTGVARPLFSAVDLSNVAILSEPTSSPTLLRLKNQFESKGGKWFQFTAVNDDNSREGARLGFGQVVRPQYHFEKAKVIVCLDADPLKLDPAMVRNSVRFAEGRDADHGTMSRLYVVECANSTTGCSADHRISLPVSKISSFLGALAAEVARRKAGDSVDKTLTYREKVLAAMAQDLRDHAGQGIILAGESQPPHVHAAIHRLNSELQNIGMTIEFTKPIDADRLGSATSLKQLCEAIKSGSINALLILGGNPVFDAPADLDFGTTLRGVSTKMHVTVQRNETSLACDWIYSAAHPLESWGDSQSIDGSHCLAQPLIEPLFGGRSPAEVVGSLLGESDAAGLALVQETAKTILADGDFATAWSRAVHDGFIGGTAVTPVAVQLSSVDLPTDDGAWKQTWSGSDLELVFVPSLSVYDGRFANSSWLQELPDFVTKLTWDNAALVSPETANVLGLTQDTTHTFRIGNHTLELPVHIQPGQAKGTMAVAIGYGRTAAGRVGGDQLTGIPSVGVAVNHLRTTSDWHWVSGVKAAGRGRAYRLAATQEKWPIDKTGRTEIQGRMLMDPVGRRSRLIREGTFESYSEFLKRHPQDDPAHARADSSRSNRDSLTFLPVINSTFHPANETNPNETRADEASHAEEHAPQWPEGIHMHHELFDLTPGVRESYKQSNAALHNVWGMSIDLNKCTGCMACVVACQAENNIPIVGKDQVQRHRHMHWIRVDSYFGENLYNKEAAASDDKMMVYQPVTCHHCENAPCETVCPVAATTHSSEGLNDMVYNRCIGTRYCGNNCPYKVRRFNYLNYSDAVTFLKYPNADRLTPQDRAVQNMMMNPEVTIRSRGVMEKCTYCVQRIQGTKIKAKVESREIGANEITTACQDACPTQAIKFGDLNHHESEVRAAHHNPRAYVMLEELNNYPRTRYLARVRNPHPALVDWDDRHGLPATHGAADTSARKA